LYLDLHVRLYFENRNAEIWSIIASTVISDELIKLLFISYKFVKGFLAISFLLFVISSWNFHEVCQRILYNQKRNFDLIRQCFYGTFFVFCRIKLLFRFLLYKKRWHTSWKFQLEIAGNKNVIAKKPLTNLYEMNSINYWRPLFRWNCTGNPKQCSL